MEIRPNQDKMKREFLPGSGHIDTAIWLHYMDANKAAGEEARGQLHKNATCNLKQVLAVTPPQDTNCTATCPLSRKLFKLDEPDMQDTAGRNQGRTHKRCTLMDPHTWPCKSRTTSTNITFSSYVRIRDVVLKTYLGQWTIGRSGERGSGISMLPARYDDDDEFKQIKKKQ